MAQVLAVAFLVPLASLYSPSDLGLFALFQSVVAFGATVASLRFDLALVLPESDLDARVLLRLARLSIVAIALVVTAATLVLRDLLRAWYSDGVLADWFFLSGAAVFLMAQTASTQLWLTRRRDFRRVAQNRMLASGVVGLFQLTMYPIFGDARGLIVGLIAGQLLTAAIITLRTPSARLRIPRDAPTVMAMARRYKKMPLLNGPNAIVDSVRTTGINFLIGGMAVSSLGQYSLAWQLTMAPAGLVQGAVAQVLLQRMAVAPRGSLTVLVRRVLVRIAFMAVPIFVVYYFLAPTLFARVFGSSWTEAGFLSQALIPWVFMLTYTSPLSNVFIVAERQQWMLAFAVAYATCPLVLLSVQPGDLLETIRIMGWMMGSLLVGLVALALVVARRFDDVQEISILAKSLARRR